MKGNNTLARITDWILGIVLVVGIVGALLIGLSGQEWQTDKELYPQNVSLAKALLVLLFLGIVVGLVAAVMRRPRPDHIVDGEATRHTLSTRVVHWVNTIGVLLALYSGVVILRWIGSPFELSQLYWFHYVGAVLVVLTVIPFTLMHRLTDSSALFPKRGDWGASLADLAGYLGIYEEGGVLGLRLPRSIAEPIAKWLASIGIRKQRAGKYLAAQRALSFTPWAILIGLVVVTGVIKAMKYFFVVPSDMLVWATFIHDWSAAAIIVVLIAHVAAVVLVPKNLPMLGSMFSGRVSLKNIIEHHPAWYEELKKAQEAPAPVSKEVPGSPTVRA